MQEARQAFDELFRDVVMSDNDMAWYIFKAGWNAAKDINRPQAIDTNVEGVREKMRQRAEIGLAKYGVTTERTDLDLRAWMKHAQEEAMDLAVYLERAMKDIK